MTSAVSRSMFISTSFNGGKRADVFAAKNKNVSTTARRNTFSRILASMKHGADRTARSLGMTPDCLWYLRRYPDSRNTGPRKTLYKPRSRPDPR